MSKRAKMAIITFFEIVGIVGTEFGFVFLWSVQLFNTIMGLETSIRIRAHHDLFV
jgi:hypothetical protein